jgi:predicted MFS family arabinose efflux permease
MGKDRQDPLGRALGTVLFSRIHINTAFRMTYPFLPAISRGLGVSFQTSSLLIAIRSVAGLSGLVFGPLGDRIGHRATMLLGLALFGAGTSLLATLPVFWIAVVAFALIGMAKAAYDPAMQAYVSARVPYNRRARALGLTELAWAGGWFLGVPVCGYLIGHFGWQSPWKLMALIVLPSLLLTILLPAGCQSQSRGGVTWFQDSIVAFVKSPRVLAALVMSFLIIFANEQFFVVYGAWMEHVFDLGPVVLGGLSTVIGVSELGGELGVTLFTDRLGKERSLLLGILSAGFFYLAVPLLSYNLYVTLLGLALLFFTFEFCVVSNIVLLSELVPEKRNTLMASFFAAVTIGRLFGAICGPAIWGTTENLLIHGIVSVGAMTGAFLLGALIVIDREVCTFRRRLR